MKNWVGVCTEPSVFLAMLIPAVKKDLELNPKFDPSHYLAMIMFMQEWKEFYKGSPEKSVRLQLL